MSSKVERLSLRGCHYLNQKVSQCRSESTQKVVGRSLSHDHAYVHSKHERQKILARPRIKYPTKPDRNIAWCPLRRQFKIPLHATYAQHRSVKQFNIWPRCILSGLPTREIWHILAVVSCGDCDVAETRGYCMRARCRSGAPKFSLEVTRS
jgi:hypothetical protein